jgi:hypothetical protein
VLAKRPAHQFRSIHLLTFCRGVSRLQKL